MTVSIENHDSKVRYEKKYNSTHLAAEGMSKKPSFGHI